MTHKGEDQKPIGTPEGWLEKYPERVIESLAQAERMELFPPLWRDFNYFSQLINGSKIANETRREFGSLAHEYLKRFDARRPGALADYSLLEKQQILYWFHRNLHW